jgi:uracil-DNA glycosylase
LQITSLWGAILEPKTNSKNVRAEAWLSYADELGLAPFYLDRAVQIAAPNLGNSVSTAPDPEQHRRSPSVSQSAGTPRETLAPAAASSPAPPAAGRSFSVAPAPATRKMGISAETSSSLFEERIENDSLDRIREDITPNCTRCKLHKARKQIVFGVGNPKAQLVFVGEGPGRDEDEQGEPFVGRAGKLLTDMIAAMGLRRQDVYICNVVKCRPPENRLPEKDEIATCSPFLARQLAVINPKVICCLGACSAQTLLNTNQGISRFRGEWFDYRGAKLIATYHPAYLLRNPAAKAEVWKDLQKVMAVLALQLPKKTKS